MSRMNYYGVYVGARSDDDEEVGGRTLSGEELAAALRLRTDIFATESDRKLVNAEFLCMVLAMGMGMYLSTNELPTIVAPGRHDHVPVREPEVRLDKDREIFPPRKRDESRRSITSKGKRAGSREKRSGGGGNIRDRVAQQGVLAYVSPRVVGKGTETGDPLSQSGFADRINAILAGVSSLKPGGGISRKLAPGIGFGTGVGNGFDGGSGGIGDLLAVLLPADPPPVGLRNRDTRIEVAPPDDVNHGITGGRSRSSIMRVVKQNMDALRYAYHRRLRAKPGLGGRVQLKFAIDEFGKVLRCYVHESDLDDPELEDTVVRIVKRWRFGNVDQPGDVTEVVYPFVFAL